MGEGSSKNLTRKMNKEDKALFQIMLEPEQAGRQSAAEDTFFLSAPQSGRRKGKEAACKKTAKTASRAARKSRKEGGSRSACQAQQATPTRQQQQATLTRQLQQTRADILLHQQRLDELMAHASEQERALHRLDEQAAKPVPTDASAERQPTAPVRADVHKD